MTVDFVCFGQIKKKKEKKKKTKKKMTMMMMLNIQQEDLMDIDIEINEYKQKIESINFT